jgi:hypothetical protein
MTGLLTLCFALVGAGVACSDGHVSFHYHDEPKPAPARHTTVVRREPAPPPVIVERTVVVPTGHVCTPYCDHYYTGAKYVVVERGHRHGPGCGHVIVEGRWVVIGKDRAAGPPPPAPRPKRVYRVP